MEVKEFVRGGVWDESAMNGKVSSEMQDLIFSSCKPLVGDPLDKAWWIANNTGGFTTKSAFELLSAKKLRPEWCKYIWNNRIPNKVSLLIWRALQGRIPTDDNLRRFRIPIVSKCGCCNIGCEETTNHLFLISPKAQKLWKHFLTCVGFRVEGG